MGAAFGSGSAGSLFGASGSANFLSRSTAVLAAVFFLTSMGLTFFTYEKGQARGVMASHKEAPPAPAVPVPPAGATGQPAAAGDSKAGQIPK